MTLILRSATHVSQANDQHRATWLLSSNVLNDNFYHSLGFVTVAEMTLGEDNPTWNGPPIVLALVRPQVYRRGFS